MRCLSFERGTYRWWENGLRCLLSRWPGRRRVGDEAFTEVFHPIAERLLEKCDAVLRVGGASSGADMMVDMARQRGLRVFHNPADVPGCS